MDISALRIYVEVVRRGSFAAVARERGVDPSSVSRTIAALEDELGIRLLQRNTRRLAPTETGMLYFDRIEPLVDEIDRAHVLAAESSKCPRGTLRILAPVSFAQLNIVPLLPELGARHPELAFDLVLTDVALDLVAERIDVAFRIGPLSDSSLIGMRLAPMTSKVCASPAYVAAHGRPRTPADLARHDCLVLDHLPGFEPCWHFVKKNGRSSHVAVHGRIHSSNAIALKQCALAGMGVTLQATWIVGRELRQGSLVDLFPSYTATAASFPSPAVWVLYPSREYVPQKVRVFLDFLKEQFRGGSPWERLPG